MGEDQYECIMEQIIGESLILHIVKTSSPKPLPTSSVQQAKSLAVTLLTLLYYLAQFHDAFLCLMKKSGYFTIFFFPPTM
jgi:hypothetical protein